jgi:beta-glucosidase
LKVARNLNRAHVRAYKKIRKIVVSPVGIVENIAIFEPLFDNVVDKLFTFIINYLATFFFIAPVSKYIDFLGINYYFKVHLQHKSPRYQFLSKFKSDAGWGIHQEGLYRVIMENLIWRKPIYITENGLADEKDKLRSKFIRDAFYYTLKAIKKGADVRGYFHWTLMDNFEWASGYSQKFGLFTIDRKPRESAKVYAQLIKNNHSEENL